MQTQYATDTRQLEDSALLRTNTRWIDAYALRHSRDLFWFCIQQAILQSASLNRVSVCLCPYERDEDHELCFVRY